MKIGIDCDEVLGEFVDPFLRFYNERNRTEWTREQIYCYNFWEVFGISKKKAIREVWEFYCTDSFANLAPVKDAVCGVRELSEFYELYIITARPKHVKNVTLSWLNNNYGNVFDKRIYFIGQFNDKVAGVKKSEVCKELGLEIIIDDCASHIKDCSQNGILTYMFKKPWNTSFRLPKWNVIPFNSWSELVEELHPI